MYRLVAIVRYNKSKQKTVRNYFRRAAVSFLPSGFPVVQKFTCLVETQHGLLVNYILPNYNDTFLAF